MLERCNISIGNIYGKLLKEQRDFLLAEMSLLSFSPVPSSFEGINYFGEYFFEKPFTIEYNTNAGNNNNTMTSRGRNVDGTPVVQKNLVNKKYKTSVYISLSHCIML